MSWMFTYNELKKFLLFCKKRYPVISFEKYDKDTKCILLRHDVDLDFYPSYILSQIEKKLGVSSTFFVLLNSSDYNIFSREIREQLKVMVDSGFEIGLHFDPLVYNNHSLGYLQDKVYEECLLLEGLIGKKVKSISLHNPSWLNKYPLFKGYTNTYSKHFFEDKKYLSDGMRVDSITHPFRGKNPYDFVESAISFPLQICLHPEQFFVEDGDYIDTITRYFNMRINKVLHSHMCVIDKIRKKVIE